MISGVDNVLRLFDLSSKNGKYHWKLYYKSSKSGSHPIATSLNGNTSSEESRARLEEYLKTLQVGDYRIDFKESWDTSSPTKMESVDFDIPRTSGIGVMQQAQHPAISAEYVRADSVKQMIEDALEKERTQREIQDLRDMLVEANKEAKRNKNQESDAIGSFLKQYAPMIMGAIFNGKNPTQIGVAGFDGKDGKVGMTEEEPEEDLEGSDEVSEELADRLDSVMAKFIEKEGSPENAIILLEKLAEFSDKNPPMYQMARTQILND